MNPYHIIVVTVRGDRFYRTYYWTKPQFQEALKLIKDIKNLSFFKIAPDEKIGGDKGDVYFNPDNIAYISVQKAEED